MSTNDKKKVKFIRKNGRVIPIKVNPGEQVVARKGSKALVANNAGIQKSMELNQRSKARAGQAFLGTFAAGTIAAIDVAARKKFTKGGIIASGTVGLLSAIRGGQSFEDHKKSRKTLRESLRVVDIKTSKSKSKKNNQYGK